MMISWREHNVHNRTAFGSINDNEENSSNSNTKRNKEDETEEESMAFVFHLFDNDDSDDELLPYEFTLRARASAATEKQTTTSTSNKNNTISIKLTGRKKICTSTGLAVWSGAEILCQFLSEHASVAKCSLPSPSLSDCDDSQIFPINERSRVLEIGAGLGLCGLFVMHAFHPDKVLLTDGDVNVLDRLQKNIQLNCNANYSCSTNVDEIASLEASLEGVDTIISCTQLIWGVNLESFQQQHGTFDVIIATNCIYMTPSLDTLWKTVDHLLTKTGVFLYVNNNASPVSQERVMEKATECGFAWTQSSNFREVFLFRRKDQDRNT